MKDLYLIARIDGQSVAISADSVDSVVHLKEMTPVPLAPRQVCGIAALRSRVITVIDTRAALELPGTEGKGALVTVVVNLDGHQYGLLVDAVEDVRAIAGAPKPVRAPLGAGWARAAAGVLDAEATGLLLLDPAALIAAPLARAA